MMSMKKYFAFIIVVLFLASCEDDGSNPGNFEFEDQTTKLMEIDEQDLFEIQNTNGNMTIIGVDTATRFYMEITRRVESFRSSESAEDHINDIVISYNSSADVLEVSVDHPESEDLDYEVDFIIYGPLIFDYRTVLGNGNMDIKSISRNFEVILGNGNAELDLILLNNCNFLMEAGNGNVQMSIPAITNAQTFITVGNGNITTTGLTFEDLVSAGNSLQGTLGNGEGNINIFLGNGNVDLLGY